MFVTNHASNRPLYQLRYQRAGQTYQSTDHLFADWRPDTLDKTLHNPEAVVTVNRTKVRNHTVPEALKEASAQIAPCLLVALPLGWATGTAVGLLAGSEAAAFVPGLAGAGLAMGLMTLAGASEYRRMRGDAGQATCEFSGYAYREKSDVRDVKLVRGEDLSYAPQVDGSILPAARSGEFQTRYIGYLKHGLPAH